jgi:Sec-independent protein translocase protein TatA
MTKILIILLLLSVLFGVIALRYRKQIQMALYVLRMFRKMRQMSRAPEEKQIEKTENTSDVQLVKCARCGTWIPQNKALNLRSKTFYCSANCMENAVMK